MMKHRYFKFLPGFSFVCDMVLLNVVLYHPVYLSYYPVGNLNSGQFLILVANLAWMIFSQVFKIYHIEGPVLIQHYISKFLHAVFYHILMLLSILYCFNYRPVLLSELFITYTAFLLIGTLYRTLITCGLEFLHRHGYNCRNVIVVGDERIAHRLIEHFCLHPEYGYDLIKNYVGVDLHGFSESQITAKLLAKKPDEIFVCYKQISKDLAACLANFGARYSVTIKMVSDLILTTGYASVVKYDNLPVLQLRADTAVRNHVKIAKRCFDVGFSLTMILSGAPLYIILHVITKITSKGPAYYYQERVGLDGKPFYIVKFRSMYVDAEKNGPQLACHNDPRVTGWGKIMRKTRLDELPQFWNVLRGDMSIVGPRPERRHFIDKISERTPHYKRLLTIRPGITSIGQIHYGYAENVDEMCERLEYDLLYLQTMSLNTDLKLIMKTVRIMVQGKGK